MIFLATQKTFGNASNALDMLQELCNLPPERPPLPVLVILIASADKASGGTHRNLQPFVLYHPIKAMHERTNDRMRGALSHLSFVHPELQGSSPAVPTRCRPS